MKITATGIIRFNAHDTGEFKHSLVSFTVEGVTDVRATLISLLGQVPNFTLKTLENAADLQEPYLNPILYDPQTVIYEVNNPNKEKLFFSNTPVDDKPVTTAITLVINGRGSINFTIYEEALANGFETILAGLIEPQINEV